MHDNSIIAIGEVDHKSRLYKFTKFYDDESSFLLTHKESTFHAPLVQHAYTLVLPSGFQTSKMIPYTHILYMEIRR
jgi:hypothetical protein